MTYTKDSIVFQPFPTDPRFKNLTGIKCGRWTVLGFAPPTGYRKYWFCECICGTIKRVASSSLLSGDSGSCGCLHREIAVAQQTTHGATSHHGRSPEYRAYSHAKNRCQNPNNDAFTHYGGRGIEFRFPSFAQFFAHVGVRPTLKHTLDRKDVNGHYEVGNVRWATKKQQARNCRSNRLITLEGVTKTVAEWCEELRKDARLVYLRISRGWCGTCSLFAGMRAGCPHSTLGA